MVTVREAWDKWDKWDKCDLVKFFQKKMATNIGEIEKWAGSNKNQKNYRDASEWLKRRHLLNCKILLINE